MDGYLNAVSAGHVNPFCSQATLTKHTLPTIALKLSINNPQTKLLPLDSSNMQRIVVVGSGFAGMWSAIAARRLISLQATGGAPPNIEVAVIAPQPKLALRPRLYEADPASMTAPLGDLFRATGVRFIRGTVDTIRTAEHEVGVIDPFGVRSTLSYDRLILAAGSRLVRPNIPGLAEHGFSVDQVDEAAELEGHLRRLASLPPSPARNTVVVCGAGFTGIEVATELPSRLRSIMGPDADMRVVVVGSEKDVGPDLGPSPRPVITQELLSQGVDLRLGARVTALDAGGVTTATGERIESLTAIWTAGMAATKLTEQIAGEKDRLGRLHVDRNLRTKSAEHVFAAGDTAYAVTDDDGNHAMMSCQHALMLGRAAGHNAAADLLGLPLRPYSQVQYVTCLGLGPSAAVVTNGWDRKVMLTGAQGHAVKHTINTQLIYPPNADEAEAFAAADPAFEIPAIFA